MSERLALDGGPRTVPEGMVQTWPTLTQADRDAVMSVFDNNQFHTRSAPMSAELERRWAEYVGAEHCIVCNGGTQALHIALASAGVQPGDEVITPAFSYWATAAPILHQNALPVFVDIDPQTYTMDPALIEERITDRTKAILPAHIHGMPADLDPIMEVAERHNLRVVHDACQAHGAKYKGRVLGSFEDTSGFSLNRSKNLSGGEGGLVTMNDDQFYECAALMGSLGGVTITDNGEERRFFGLGYNYRPHEFISAFVLSQLDRLDEMNARRIEMAEFLTEGLEQIPGVAGPYTPEWAEPVYFTYVLEFRPEELGLDVTPKEFKAALAKALAAEGLSVGQWSRVPLPAMDIFQEKVGYGRGCPWSCSSAGEVRYDVEDYPATIEFIASHTYLGGVNAANDMKLMELYLQGFRKATDNLERVLELAGEDAG